MSTSLMYHAFGLKGYHYEKTEYCFGEIHFYIRQPAQRIRCPLCQSLGVIRKGFKERHWRSLPIGKKTREASLKNTANFLFSLSDHPTSGSFLCPQEIELYSCL